MTLSRRSFAKYLGLAPLAAKEAGDAAISRLTGVGVGAPSFQLNSGVEPAPISSMADYAKSRIAASEYVNTVGLPDFVREAFRRDAQWVDRLDPDLAAKRSWSMSVKILTQRERNLQRRIEALHHGAWQSQGSTLFKKLTGWDWPW